MFRPMHCNQPSVDSACSEMLLLSGFLPEKPQGYVQIFFRCLGLSFGRKDSMLPDQSSLPLLSVIQLNQGVR